VVKTGERWVNDVRGRVFLVDHKVNTEFANQRNFYKEEKSTNNGSKVDRLRMPATS
jgi:hypothetical protein